MSKTSLATRLKSRRQQLGLTVTELARRAEIDHSTIVKLERGNHSYSRHLFVISDVLKVNVDWLYRGKGRKFPVKK